GDNHALVTGIAYSVGPYRAPLITQEYTPEYSSKFAQWVQGDIGWEWRSDDAFLFRLAVGLAAMLNRGSVQCFAVYRDTCDLTSPIVIPTLDLAIGGAL